MAGSQEVKASYKGDLHAVIRIKFVKQNTPAIVGYEWKERGPPQTVEHPQVFPGDRSLRMMYMSALVFPVYVGLRYNRPI